jgi:putative hemolysin
MLSVAIVVLPLSFITIVFAELTPKTFALKNKEWVVLHMSPYMKVLYNFLSPIVGIMEDIVGFLTKKTLRKNVDPKEAKKAAMADLRAAVAIASNSRLFGKSEEKIVLSSAMFCVRQIKEIQVPLNQVYMLYANDSIAETFIKAHLDMHTRFPVYDNPDDRQSIIGYLNFKDIFNATKTVAQGKPPTTRSILRPILRMDEDTIISSALEQLMKAKQHICLVTDDDQITGILTLEDIFEEMVGEIEDEYDFFPAYIRPFGDALIVSATAQMTEVFKQLELPVPDMPAGQTAQQWAEGHTGHPLDKSETISADGISLAARKFRRKKLMEVLVTKI